MVVEGGFDGFPRRGARVLQGLVRILEPLVVHPDTVPDRTSAQSLVLPKNITAREILRSAGEGVGLEDVTGVLGGLVRFKDEHGGNWYAVLGSADRRVPRKYRNNSVSGPHSDTLASANRVLVLGFG